MRLWLYYQRHSASCTNIDTRICKVAHLQPLWFFGWLLDKWKAVLRYQCVVELHNLYMYVHVVPFFSWVGTSMLNFVSSQTIAASASFPGLCPPVWEMNLIPRPCPPVWEISLIPRPLPPSLGDEPHSQAFAPQSGRLASFPGYSPMLSCSYSPQNIEATGIWSHLVTSWSGDVTWCQVRSHDLRWCSGESKGRHTQCGTCHNTERSWDFSWMISSVYDMWCH